MKPPVYYSNTDTKPDFAQKKSSLFLLWCDECCLSNQFISLRGVDFERFIATEVLCVNTKEAPGIAPN